jgi:hypothetical protein
MDDIGSSGPYGNEDLDEPVPIGDDTGQMKVSHSPLNLGGGDAARPAKLPVEKPVSSTGSERAVEKPPTDNKGSADRITGVKTFFTKLHPGAMEFLDEQIQKWLRENPGAHIKLTNTTTGVVQAKKTEPNIIIHVWY